ncbi:cyclic nucleotide-binding domain-containing protein [Devosia sp.]|uniref:cyclic nucleotide-binding domain-containing protein n=1 Tax=Devosia sp. TaxID=1871048 RepID=UPI003BA939DE
MSPLASFTDSLPLQQMTHGTLLTEEGSHSGRLFILEKGRLTVLREGVILAKIDEPGAVIGEMAALLGTPHSATVRADGLVSVRVMEDAVENLGQNAELALHIATIACARLDATSALLVELRRNLAGRDKDQALLSRILTALTAPPKGPPRPRSRQTRSYMHE